jgi:preprotein translocase subunit SecD
MNRRQYWMLALIIFLIVLAAFIVKNGNITIVNPVTSAVLFTRNTSTRLGLDLRGGLQTLLEVPEEYSVSANDLATARDILEQRSNALGVSEVQMQTAGQRRIVAEFPGISNPEEVIASLQQTGLLEFVDMGGTRLDPGTLIETDFGKATQAPSIGINDQLDPSALPVLHTVMTGTALDSVSVGQDSITGEYVINFVLKAEMAKLFSDYTRDNTNKILGIVLDKRVISAPQIQNQISDGKGLITGNFTRDSANSFAVQLRYGSLPVPVVVVESRAIGPTLGAESVRKSLIAGLIGLTAVMVFMALYYRVPGVIADAALICYTLFSLALFNLIPVVLTLPGIAGFILSIGMAVDANILIFERMKEELRAGRTLRQAIDLGWSRAWPSIRDSNVSTLITCAILFWFGNAFGASMVKGFAVTLSLGVLVSLFTAIIVSRTFLHVVLDNLKLSEHPRWFGI